MFKREIAVIACRTLAVIALIRALHSSVYVAASFCRAARELFEGVFVSFRVEPQPLRDAALQGAPLVLLLLLALFLWKRADFCAAKMLGEASRNQDYLVPLKIHPQLQSLAFSCVGLWIIVQALSRVAPVFTGFALAIDSNPRPLRDWLNLGLFEVLSLPFQLILGFWLFFGARSLVGTLNYLRRLGRDPESRQETPAASIPKWPEN